MRTQADLDRNAGALKEDGLPDGFNRLLLMTPEQFNAIKEAAMTSKIGPREQALRDQREALAKENARPARKPAERPAPAPAVRQPAPEAPAPDEPKETTVKKSTTKKAPAKKSTRAAKKAAKVTAAPKTTENGSKIEGPREGSKLAIIDGLLKRKEGCTTKDVLAATGWPAVSMPQQAKALGITLRKEKDGSASRYFAG